LDLRTRFPNKNENSPFDFFGFPRVLDVVGEVMDSIPGLVTSADWLSLELILEDRVRIGVIRQLEAERLKQQRLCFSSILSYLAFKKGYIRVRVVFGGLIVL